MPMGSPIIIKRHPSFFYSFKYYIISLIILAIGIYANSFLLIILAVVVFLLIEVVRMATSYFLLEVGILREYNLFSTNRKFAEYDKIQNLEVTQTFLQKILGIGDVKFDTPGSDMYEIHFDNINNPRQIERIVREKMAPFN